MTLEYKKDQLIKEFHSCANWEERYKKLIVMGKSLPPLKEIHRVEKNKVRGCQSQVWLWVELRENLLYFEADSDSAIAKGMASLLTTLYSGETPEAVLNSDHDFIDKIGLKQHLTMSRANGLASMLKQIQLYAMAFQAKAKMGL